MPGSEIVGELGVYGSVIAIIWTERPDQWTKLVPARRPPPWLAPGVSPARSAASPGLSSSPFDPVFGHGRVFATFSIAFERLTRRNST